MKHTLLKTKWSAVTTREVEHNLLKIYRLSGLLPRPEKWNTIRGRSSNNVNSFHGQSSGKQSAEGLQNKCVCCHGQRSRTHSPELLHTKWSVGQTSGPQSTEDRLTKWSAVTAREVQHGLLTIDRLSDHKIGAQSTEDLQTK